MRTHVRSVAIFILALGLPVFAHAGDARLDGLTRQEPGLRLALLGQGLEVPPDRLPPHPLHAAALNNRVTEAIRLIGGGMAADQRDNNGNTPLMVAAAFGNAEVAAVLIKLGADVNAHDDIHGATPLHFAAVAGRPALMHVLLASGARLDIRDTLGETPLHYAAFYNRGAMIEELAAAGADLNVPNNAGLTAFSLASRYGRVAGAAVLSRLGALDGGLIAAVNAGDLTRVRKLLAEGVDVNTAEISGTALHYAAAKGYIAIAAVLIEAGADLEAVGDPGRGHPLHLSALVGDAPMTAFLIESGAAVDARDAQGRTPLEIAATFQSAAVVELLLTKTHAARKRTAG